MGKLFAVLVTIITLVSAALFALRVWWLPPDISVLGAGIDHQLSETMVASGVLFVLAQLALAVFVWRSSGGTRPIRTFPGGATPMVVAAVAIVGAEILVLSFVGSKVWSRIVMAPPDTSALHIDVQAEQFAFYFRYPGVDGTFGAAYPEKIDEATTNFFGLDPANDVAARDDIVSGTLAIPVNRHILLTLHAKDVSHSFFIPTLRIHQDFVPGLVIPVQFTATQLGRHEIVCTQLCGLGHYNMRAFVEVMTPEQFNQWLIDQAP